jgi:hypothetical protein
MCQDCEGLSDKQIIEYPYQLFSIVNQIKIFIEHGTIKIIQGNCNLYDIQEGKPWPEDHIVIDFACNNCGQIFSFHCETYHGRGGAWEIKD